MLFFVCCCVGVCLKAASGDKQQLLDGMTAYNGVLVGCALSALVPVTAVGHLGLVAMITAGSAATVPLYFALSRALANARLPQLTLAFNAVAVPLLAPFRPLDHLPATAAAATQSLPTAAADTLLNGISQIYLVSGPVFAAAVLLAVAASQDNLASAGRHAGYAVLGSASGAVYGLLVAADVTTGLMGFNACLTALAVSTFVQHSPR